MSLAVTMMMAGAVTGTNFACTVDTAYLSVFAPAESVTAAYPGNVLTLYKVEGDGEIFPAPPRIQRVSDDLPSTLAIAMTTGDAVSIDLELTGYDAAKNTADVRITAQMDGASLGTLSGTCVTSSANGLQTQ